MQAQGQITIYDLNDVYTGSSAPASPYTGQLWVDTSQTPPVTKVYTGSAWKEQNGTDDLRSNKADAEGGENATGKFGWSLTQDGFVMYSDGKEAMLVDKNGNAVFKGHVMANKLYGEVNYPSGSILSLWAHQINFSSNNVYLTEDSTQRITVSFSISVSDEGNGYNITVTANRAVIARTSITAILEFRHQKQTRIIEKEVVIEAGYTSASEQVLYQDNFWLDGYECSPLNKTYSVTDAISVGGHLIPSADNQSSLGKSGKRWNAVWAVTGSIQTSDRNSKKDIAPLDSRYGALFDLLVPVQYKFIDGTSGRTHTGLIAQDVEDAMSAVGLSGADFAGLIKSENGYGLRYGEFIALCISELQKLKARVAELEEKKT